jgi:hypothetical protein
MVGLMLATGRLSGKKKSSSIYVVCGLSAFLRVYALFLEKL